jgi:uncharacterized protein YbjT (DUF2867 family)
VSDLLITVFGGTGFVGSRIVRHVVAAGARARIAARSPVRPGWAVDSRTVELVSADIHNEQDVARAVRGASAVVNAVSLYVEGRGGNTFDEIHVRGAVRLAEAARAAGAQKLVTLSGIGVSPKSASPYVRARLRGETATRTAFPATVVVRPSVVFGPGDAFLGTLAGLTRLPLIPLFGRGETQLQPVHVDDVAQGVVRILGGKAGNRKVFEFGGAEVLSYGEILELVMAHLDRRRRLVPVPFPVWRGLAWMLKVLPKPPLTLDQVVLMERDNVASGSFGRFADLGLTPRGLSASLGECLDAAPSG